MFLTFVLFSLLIIVILIFLRNKQTYWHRKGVPYIESHLIWGNIKGVGSKYHIMDPINDVYNKFKSSSVIAGITDLLGNSYVATNLDLIKSIMIKDFSYFCDRNSYVNEKDDPLSANMLNLSGKQWREIRGKLTPTFTSGKIKSMYPIITQIAQEMTKVITSNTNNDSMINVRDIMSRFTVDVIATCAFGIDCHSLKDPENIFLEKGRSCVTNPRHGPILMSFIWSFPNIASLFRLKVTRDDVSSFFLNMVKETVNYRELNNVSRSDFMELLINLKNNYESQLTLNEISAQAFIFFIAGFETSSTVLGYMIHELSLNPEIQAQARSEILSIIGENKVIQYEQLSKLNYLNMIFYETLRKYPPVPIVLRKAVQNYTIPGTNIEIEKDQKVIIPIYAVQNDEEIYKNPNIFDPKRFLPEAISSRPSNSMLAFGDGPRYDIYLNCYCDFAPKVQIY